MMMGGGELYFRNKEFLFQNNGLKQTLHGHRLFDGLFFLFDASVLVSVV